MNRYYQAPKQYVTRRTMADERREEIIREWAAPLTIAALLVVIIVLSVKLIDARHEARRAKGLLNTQFQAIVGVEGE